MKNLLLALVFISTSFLSYAQTITTANVHLRDKPSTSASSIEVIPAGSVLILDDCSNGWCQTTFHGQVGYVSHKYISERGAAPDHAPVISKPIGRIKHYTNSAGQQVQSPTHYSNVPDGATAECRDGTYSFSANHRGTCSHHGGVKRWLR